MCQFVQCTAEDCPIPHGYIEDNRHGRMTGTVTEVKEALAICLGTVQAGTMTPSDGVHVLQQTLAANLPWDRGEWMKRYNALSEATRTAVAEKSRERMLDVLAVILGLFNGNPCDGCHDCDDAD